MVHHSTILSQLLQLVDRHDFRKIEQAGFAPKRKYRTLSRWSQFVAMMFAQLGNRQSLRDIEGHFDAHSARLYHAGAGAVRRSTLADANNDRPAEYFQAIFDRTYARCAAVAPKKRFRFKNKLYSFDSTVIDLCLSVFPWASFRSTKGGIKAHTLLDHDGLIPAFVEVSDAKTSDIEIARTLCLPPGSIVAVDRAYTDFKWFAQMEKSRSFFVTRLKRNISYRVIERRAVRKETGVTSDQTIMLDGPKSADCTIPLRRVGYRDPQTGKHFFFLTNIFHLCAKTVADIYKQRWQVELFFKWIKQNLRIKSFLGTSKNAVLTQIWIAMITIMLLAYYKWRAKLGHSITEILKLLQLTLFERRNLYELFEPPPVRQSMATNGQLSFNFSSF
jgi:transposase